MERKNTVTEVFLHTARFSTSSLLFADPHIRWFTISNLHVIPHASKRQDASDAESQEARSPFEEVITRADGATLATNGASCNASIVMKDVCLSFGNALNPSLPFPNHHGTPFAVHVRHQ